MKILLAADMEGITGVVHWDHVSPDHADYKRFRKAMTDDVNAAVRGVYEAGADEVWVADGHAHGRNLLIEALDARAQLQCGSPSPFAMLTGIDHDVDGVGFIGYHARAGAAHAVLDHTWSSSRVHNVWLNETRVGEIGLNAAVCGHFDAPVVMLSGDQTACAEAQALLGDVECAVVKEATGRMSARCLPVEQAQSHIQDAARRAVERLAQGTAPAPWSPTPPITLVVEFTTSEMADNAALLPGTERDERRVHYTAEDMVTVYRAFRSLVAMA